MVAKKEAHKKDDQPVVNDADQSVAVIADDPKPKAQKKDAPKVTVEEKNGQAVAVVNVPAHKAEVPLARSSIDGVIAATVEAWHKVKGKDDAEFALARPEFRQDLINHAEEVWSKNTVTEGDTVMARFEQEVAQIKLREEKAKAAKAA